MTMPGQVVMMLSHRSYSLISLRKSIAAEQVGIGMRMTNDAPFSVVSLVPGGAAALSGEIKPKVRSIYVK